MTGKLNLYYFPPDRVESQWLADFTQLVGRVVAEDVEPGMILTERSLLPVGARPGLAAAIPEGLHGIEVAGDRVQGLQELSRGEVFDIWATIPETMAPPPPLDLATLYGGKSQPAVEAIHEQLRTGLRRVAEGTLLIRAANSSESTAIVAVSPNDVVPLTQR
ncbi:MAG: hypothetical protein R3B90_13730 [Planctomycetaceae bacterium]